MAHAELILHEEFSNAEELLAAIQRRDGRWAPYPHQWVYRGHADARWKLIPAALRPGSLREYEYTRGPERRHGHRRQIEKEHAALRAFVEACDSQGLSIPDDSPMTRAEWRENIQLCAEMAMEGRAQWPPNATLSMLALAQHYGVHTRLLDWTSRPLVAAYFAAVEAARWCKGEKTPPEGATHMELWALHRRGLAHLAPPTGSHDCAVKIVAPSPAHNPNLHAQMGVFTLITTRFWDPYTRKENDELDTVLARRFQVVAGRTAGLAPPLPWLRRMRLPLAEAPTLLRLLSYEWVSATHLYPGYRGVARGLAERRFWDNPEFEEPLPNASRPAEPASQRFELVRTGPDPAYPPDTPLEGEPYSAGYHPGG